MDCVVEAGLPPRRSSPLPPRSPYSSSGGGGGGACDSSSTSDCSQSGGCAGGGGGGGGAAVVAASDAAVDELVKGRHPQPFPEHHHHQHPLPQQQQQQHAAVNLCYSDSNSAPSHPVNEEAAPQHRQQQQQHETSTKAAFNKCLSLSTCGGSASNLTTLGGNTTSVTTATSASVTGSSATSTPLSGASSHQQQRIRALAQRVVDEANQQRASLDSRSSSAHRDNEEEEYGDDEAIANRAVGHPAHPDTASPAAAAAAVAGPHFTSRSTPSSKRPRQQAQPTQQQQQQQQVSTDAATRAMHIPDITTFADSSSARTTSPMTTANTSPIPAEGNGSTTTNARVHDRVDYEGEIHRAVEANTSADTQTQTAFTTTATMTVVKVPMMAAGSHSVTHAVAPDATPTEPAPKRFATGEGADMEELGYAVLHSRSSTAKVSSDFLSQPSSTAAEGMHYDDNEEVDKQQQRPDSHQRRHRRHATAEEEEEDAGRSDSTAHTRPGERRGSAVSRRANAAGKEGSRRKARLTTGGSVGSLLGGGRYTNDSITASIPYDPTRFNTPPLAQQVQSEESPFTQSSSSVPLRPEQGTRQGSESQPSCATPPEVQVLVKAPVAVSPQPNSHQQQQQQQQQTTQSFTAPAATPSVKLTETRFAFLALSFMMRTLCKLHKGEPIPSSDFHSHCIPPMSVTMYVQRLVRYCACSGEALLCSFILLLKYVFHSGHPITIYNAHRLLITSILLGIKLRDDVYYSNVYYGRIGGISGREMNKLEVLFLSKLNWETQVYEDEYAALLSLLEEIAIDVDPTPEQLAAFAAAYPDKVAAYVPDDDDDEIEEAAAKLQQGGTATGTSATSSFTTNATKANTHNVAESPVDVLRRKTHRGAYRLHQWHTKVEPWIAQLQQHVFARSSATAQSMSAAWQEEGQRWAQYYRDDEEASARLQRETSASAWLSPLTVQRRATSAATLPAQAAGTGESVSWLVEPPYQSAWPSADASAHHAGGSNSYAGQQPPQQQQPSSSQQQQQPGETNPRYSNFINFANVVTGGYFGPSSSTGGGGAGSAVNRYVSPATMGQTHSASTGFHGGASAGARVPSSSSVRYHSGAAAAPTVATASAVFPPRQPSATFDITNRATTASFSAFGVGAEVGRQSEGNSRHSHGSGSSSNTTQPPPPSVAGTTVRTASPTSSSSVPGSGINVNAQPYYYVSSRMRKQQQQEQQSATTTPANQDPSPASVKVASTAVTGFGGAATAAAASPSEANDPSSRSSSFTSPACVNSATRLGTAFGRATGATPSSGMEAVLAAMKRGTGSVGPASANTILHDAHDTATNNSSSGATLMTTPGGSLTFPARPIPKAALAGHEGEHGASLHMARRSPQSAHPPAAQRRSTYASQHSLGKKRSKPDSYKDY